MVGMETCIKIQSFNKIYTVVYLKAGPGLWVGFFVEWILQSCYSQMIIMKTEHQGIYDRLHKLYKKHLRRFKNPDSRQICCMWSTHNPPDEIYDCTQMDDIQDEFNIHITENDAFDLYEMKLDEATEFIAKLIKNPKHKKGN